MNNDKHFDRFGFNQKKGKTCSKETSVKVYRKQICGYKIWFYYCFSKLAKITQIPFLCLLVEFSCLVIHYRWDKLFFVLYKRIYAVITVRKYLTHYTLLMWLMGIRSIRLDFSVCINVLHAVINKMFYNVVENVTCYVWVNHSQLLALDE